MAISAEIEEKIYDEYMRTHRVARIPKRVTDAVAYLNENAVMYADKIPSLGIDIDRYCFGFLCFDTISHRNMFYRMYGDVAAILDQIAEDEPFSYRYVKFDLLMCCIYDNVVITRYVRSVTKALAGFFESDMRVWAVNTAVGVWNEVAPEECEKVGGSFGHYVCPDELDRGFNNGIFIVSYSEVGYKKNVINRFTCVPRDRPKVMSGENVYAGNITQDRWNKV